MDEIKNKCKLCGGVTGNFDLCPNCRERERAKQEAITMLLKLEVNDRIEVLKYFNNKNW